MKGSGFGPKTRINSFIHNRVSPRLTNLSSTVGFANRNTLASHIKQSVTSMPNEAIKDLVSNGILKSGFSGKISSLSEIEPHMLSNTITRKSVENSSIFNSANIDSIFEKTSERVTELVDNVVKGYEWLDYTLPFKGNRTQTLIAFSLGSLAALGIVTAVVEPSDGMKALGAIGYEIFSNLGSIPKSVYAGAAAILLGIGTAAGVLGAKFADRLPPASRLSRLARFAGRKILPLSILGDGALLTGLLFEANMRVSNLFEAMGLGGTVLFLGGGALLIGRYIKKTVNGLNSTYNAQIDPGSKSGRKMMARMASLSISSEINYLSARTILLTAASAYIIANIASGGGTALLVPLAIPLVGIGARYILDKTDIQTSSAKLKKQLDKLTIYSPLLGIGGGLALSIAESVAMSSYKPLIAFSLFWGSFGNLLFNEIHGSFHAMNTTFGHITNMQASSIDLMDTIEAARLAQNARVLIINPHTGTHEHSYGILYSTLLSRKPGLSFVCMFDKPLVNSGTVEMFRAEKELIRWIKSLQEDIFITLSSGINGATTDGKYLQLAENLEDLATHFEGNLPLIIEGRVEAHPKSFEKDVNEYLRAANEALLIRAQEFREIAQKLREKHQHNEMSEADFYNEWAPLLASYDPHLTEITSVARKELAGDEWKARKVENISTIGLFRGMTIYKAWFTENEVYPTTEWISGTWTRIPNPNFRYDANPDSMEASKYLWIERTEVMSGLQRTHEKELSTSKTIVAMDNNPANTRGFARADAPITIEIDGQQRTLNNYFYVVGKNQLLTPRGTPILRDGVKEEKRDIKIAGMSEPEESSVHPTIFTIPPFDYTLMMDKNDIQIDSYLVEPALLIRAAERTHANLIYEYPLAGNIEIENPHPLRKVDKEKGVQIIDGNIELSYDGRVIPFLVDRSFINAGRTGEKIILNSIEKAEIRRKGKNSFEFVLIYSKVKDDDDNPIEKRVEVVIPESAHPRYLSSLNLPPLTDKPIELKINNFMSNPHREGDTSWFKINYVEGPPAFVRAKHRPIHFDKEVF